MKEYYCKRCKYYTRQKGHFNKHLKTKKHLDGIQMITEAPKNDSQLSSFNTFSDNQVSETPNTSKVYNCKFCGSGFKHRQSMYRHMKSRCKKTEYNEMQELADLMNKKLEDKNNQLVLLQKQIDDLKSKLQIQNINNGINIQGDQNNTTNIQLLNYNKTDYDFLKEKDFVRCFMDNNHCVKALIEKVHFNKNKPENMNIYISCIKGKFVMVYRDNEWQIRDRQKQIDDLYETNEIILENWYDDYSEKYPHIIKSFTRYLKNKEEDTELIKNVKSEILLMLYNKRNIKNKVIGETDNMLLDI